MTTLAAFAGDEDGTEAVESGDVVVATCSACNSTHPVADRKGADDTTASTVCPECGSPSYATDVVEEVDP